MSDEERLQNTPVQDTDEDGDGDVAAVERYVSGLCRDLVTSDGEQSNDEVRRLIPVA